MDEIMPVHGIAAAWQALGWETTEIDGHDCFVLLSAVAAARASASGRPKLIVARTVKGRGVPFLEHTTESHFPPPLSEAEIALVDRLAAGDPAHAGR